jgi:hypothetical protein
MTTVPSVRECLWCRRGFTPRRDGGKAQRFCREACRRSFDAAGRSWVAEALADGALTIPDLIRNASSATRALAGGGKIPSETPPPAPEPLDPVLGALSAAADDAPAPVAPEASHDEAAELLLDIATSLLLSDAGEKWGALADLLDDELFNRLDAWLEPHLA